jgi:hypothetical protein
MNAQHIKHFSCSAHSSRTGDILKTLTENINAWLDSNPQARIVSMDHRLNYHGGTDGDSQLTATVFICYSIEDQSKV